MQILKASAVLVLCSTSQSLTEPIAIAQINKYVTSINTSKELAILQLGAPYVKHHDKLSRDSIFWVYDTDFGCAATIYRLRGRLVKVREIVRISSGFAVNSYYLSNKELVFIEEKNFICSFNKQVLKNACPEKSRCYNNYYFFKNACLASIKQGECFITGSGYHPDSTIKRTHTGFLAWQAARYVALFDKSTAK